MPIHPVQTVHAALEQLANAGPIFLALVGVVVVIGAALWLAGARLLRPMLLAAGAAAGVGVGGLWMAPHFSNLPDGIIRLLVPLAIGLACGWVVAALGYRFFVGVLSGATLSAVAVAAVLAFHGAAPASSAPQWTLHNVAQSLPPTGAALPALDLRADNFLAQVRVAGDAALHAAGARWDQLDPRTRTQAGLAGVIVGLLGLLAGLAAPRSAAVVPTSLIGSALCLAGLLLAATATQWAPHTADLCLTPLTVCWGVLALVGVGVQGAGLARRAPQPTT